MKRFVKEYNGKGVKDCGAFLSKEFESLSKKLKNAVKRELPDFEIMNWRTGHYDMSWFLVKDDVCIYCSYSVPRNGYPINTKATDAMNGLLYRTAATTHDFHGGPNNFCSLETIRDSVNRLYGKEHREEEETEEMER